jgi:hypothetical protein
MKILSIPAIDEVLTAAVWNKDYSEQELRDLCDMPWDELATELELGDSVYMAIDEETATDLMESIVADALQMNKEAKLDAYQEAFDLQMMQGLESFLSNRWKF